MNLALARDRLSLPEEVSGRPTWRETNSIRQSTPTVSLTACRMLPSRRSRSANSPTKPCTRTTISSPAAASAEKAQASPRRSRGSASMAHSMSCGQMLRPLTMIRQRAAAHDEVALANRPVEPEACEAVPEAQADADFSHAVARQKRPRIEARRREGFGEAVQHRRLDHVGADARDLEARQIELAGHLALRAARHQVVAEARAVGDGGAATRDQRQPLHRPAGKIARRQKI